MVDRLSFAISLPSSAHCDIFECSPSYFIHSGVALFISRFAGAFTTDLQISHIKLSGGLFLIAHSIGRIFIHHLTDYSCSGHFRSPLCRHLVVSPCSEAEGNKLGDVCKKETKGQEKEATCKC